MSIFPTTAEFRADIEPMVADAAKNLGSLADLYQLQSVEQDDATFEDVPALTLDDVELRLSMVSAETVLTTFGEEPSIKFQGSMIKTIDINEGDVFGITEGAFTGSWLRVVRVRYNQYSNAYTLGLAEAEAIV